MSVSLPSLFACDDMFSKLMDPSVKWGDIMMDEEPTTTSETYREMLAALEEESKPRLIEITLEEEALENWSVPDLRLRKGIWENFPVDVIPMRTNDGTDRYRIVWNAAKLADWRNWRPESWDEYQDYEGFSEVRLLHALKAHPQKYVVEPAYDNSAICTIAMVHVAGEDAAPASIPAGKRALEVLRNFPISWDRDGKIHRIKLHRKRATEMGVTERQVSSDVMAALQECVDCRLSAGGPGYIVTVTLL